MSTQGQGDVSARLIDAILNKPKRRVNRPDDAESGKRLVGWVIDEADAGMSEALFALEGIEARLRTLLSSSRGEQGWRTMDSAPTDGTHIIGNTQWGAREIWWHKDTYEGEYWTDEGDSEPEPTGWIPMPGPVPTWDITTINKALRKLADVWELDGDLMRCRGCGRALIASRHGEELHHHAECKHEGSQVFPCIAIAAVIRALGREA